LYFRQLRMLWWTAFWHLPLSSSPGRCGSSLLWHDLQHPAVGSHWWQNLITIDDGSNGTTMTLIPFDNNELANFKMTNTDDVVSQKTKWQCKL
jgi:hypothetical protein